MGEDMPSAAEEELERMIQFLYVVPVGLLEFDARGLILMANPTITQLFNPFSLNGMISNIYDVIRPQLPELGSTH